MAFKSKNPPKTIAGTLQGDDQEWKGIPNQVNLFTSYQDGKERGGQGELLSYNDALTVSDDWETFFPVNPEVHTGVTNNPYTFVNDTVSDRHAFSMINGRVFIAVNASLGGEKVFSFNTYDYSDTSNVESNAESSSQIIYTNSPDLESKDNVSLDATGYGVVMGQEGTANGTEIWWRRSLNLSYAQGYTATGIVNHTFGGLAANGGSGRFAAVSRQSGNTRPGILISWITGKPVAFCQAYSTNSDFGKDIAIGYGRIVVTAPFSAVANPDPSVYIFDYHGNLIRRLVQPYDNPQSDGTNTSDKFGDEVLIANGLIYVSGPSADVVHESGKGDAPFLDSGRIWIYTLDGKLINNSYADNTPSSNWESQGVGFGRFMSGGYGYFLRHQDYKVSSSTNVDMYENQIDLTLSGPCQKSVAESHVGFRDAGNGSNFEEVHSQGLESYSQDGITWDWVTDGYSGTSVESLGYTGKFWGHAIRGTEVDTLPGHGLLPYNTTTAADQRYHTSAFGDGGYMTLPYELDFESKSRYIMPRLANVYEDKINRRSYMRNADT